MAVTVSKAYYDFLEECIEKYERGNFVEFPSNVPNSTCDFCSKSIVGDLIIIEFTRDKSTFSARFHKSCF